ncbi:heme-binding protein [Thiomicrorhabdus sp.]|uniref:GlcG/HbpS family heme-binding protein n=1 Tax=Thiomicrorhabdus sp. TaxID=2039724 RepID=UPI0029C62DC7|nr:heme-binding protein [Thiomicrorhabdus sp.]
MKGNWSKIAVFLGLSVATLATGNLYAADVVEEKNIGMELARDLASEAVYACRENGFSVSAVVVDRHGNRRAVLRDDFASRFTMQIAEEKANATVMSGLKSGQFRELRGDIRPELNHVDGVLILIGAVPIMSNGIRIGALGVSGAPGGEKDEVCAAKAIEKLADRLEDF